MDEKKAELCMIRIMFPVESDDQAIDYKKKIAFVLKDQSDVNIQFSITSGLPEAIPPMR